MPTIAKTVVFNAEEFVFDVDGKPFPWHLPEHPQVSARKITDGLYAVELAFMAVIRDHETSPLSFEQTEWDQPFICGIEFPWWIDEDGVKFTVCRTDISMVELTFFAEHVEGIEVAEATSMPEDGKVREIRGRCIARVT